jgi:hypothetical protein
MFIARYLVGVRKRRKAEGWGDVVDDGGAVTWIYNEFSCLARVRIRKAKVPGSKGWEMVAVKGKKEVKKDGGEEGEDGKGIDGSNEREKNSSRAKGKREKKKRK